MLIIYNYVLLTFYYKHIIYAVICLQFTQTIRSLIFFRMSRITLRHVSDVVLDFASRSGRMFFSHLRSLSERGFEKVSRTSVSQWETRGIVNRYLIDMLTVTFLLGELIGWKSMT